MQTYQSATDASPRGGQQAGREGACCRLGAAHTVNDRLQGTAVERAAVICSDSKIQKSDRLLTHGSKLGRARGQRIVMGGVALRSLNM
jgi:hypothetical protein